MQTHEPAFAGVAGVNIGRLKARVSGAFGLLHARCCRQPIPVTLCGCNGVLSMGRPLDWVSRQNVQACVGPCAGQQVAAVDRALSV